MKRKPKHLFHGGFALVATLSMVILLTIVALGLLQLATVTLRSTGHGSEMAKARANAKLGLIIAIGDLQKHTGSDQRVTAPASIFDTDPETPPLNLLLNVLVGGESSRLHRLLVEDEELALEVNGFQDEGFDPGLAYFYLTLPPGGDPAVVERRLLDELQRIVDDGVTEAELTKARNIVLADFWRGLATIDGKAAALGNHAVFLGDYESLFALPDELEAISIDDIQKAAAQVFRVENMTVGVLQEALE